MPKFLRIAAIALVVLALGPFAARAATPVQIGTGIDPTVVMTADGHAHIVWAHVPEPENQQWSYCDLAYGASSCAHTMTLSGAPHIQSSPTIFSRGSTFEVWGNSQCNGINSLIRFAFTEGGSATRTCATGSTGGGEITSGGAFLDSRPGHDWLLGAGTIDADPRFFHAFQVGDAVPGAQVFDAGGSFYGPTVAESGSARDGSGDTLAMAAGYLPGYGTPGYGDPSWNHVVYAVYSGLASGAGISALNNASNWDGNLYVPGSQDADVTQVHAIPGGAGVPVIVTLQPVGGPDSILIARLTRPVDAPFTTPGITTTDFAAGPSDAELITNLEGSEDPVNGLNLTWVSGGRLRYAHEVGGTMTLQGTVSALPEDVSSQDVDTNVSGHGYEVYSTPSERIMAVPLEATHDSADDPPPAGGGGAGGSAGGGGDGGTEKPKPAPKSGAGPISTTSASLGHGLVGGLTVPRQCVPGGDVFNAKVAVKRKGSQAHKTSYTVKSVTFLLGKKKISTDRTKPFEVDFATKGIGTGKALAVAARISVGLHLKHKTSTVTKTLKATVRICG
ncbi:MAG TPA: hypothetical protein VMF55_12600 [Solirubrobacterales bacterium]|nr:hypothetical protein [Solirubrobacterales bacterium]